MAIADGANIMREARFQLAPMTVPDLESASVIARRWPVLAGSPIERAVGGVNRAVFRAGDHWLTAMPAASAGRLERETSLCADLARQPPSLGWEIRVPEPVTVVGGCLVIVEGALAWRLVSHVDGTAPSPADFAVYGGVGEAVSALHRMLTGIPVALAVFPHPLTAALAAAVDEWSASSAANVAESWPGERADEVLHAAHRALKHVADRVEVVVTRDRQLVHNDLYFPNLLIDVDAHRVGILDWEFSCVDGPIVDLASLAIAALCRSGDPDRGVVAVDEMISVYRGRYRIDDVLACALALKVVSYWFHRSRAATGVGLDVALAQRAHLPTCLRFLDGVAA